MVDYSVFLEESSISGGVFSFYDLEWLYDLPMLSETVLFNTDLDSISYRFYKTEQLWWVIAFVNRIVDPFLFTEEPLQIPQPDILELEFHKRLIKLQG